MVVTIACHLIKGNMQHPILCPVLCHLTAQRSSVSCSVTQVDHQLGSPQCLEVNQRTTSTVCIPPNRFKPTAAVNAVHSLELWTTTLPLTPIKLKTRGQALSVKPPLRLWMKSPANCPLLASTPQPLWPHRASPSVGVIASLHWA